MGLSNLWKRSTSTPTVETRILKQDTRVSKVSKQTTRNPKNRKGIPKLAAIPLKAGASLEPSVYTKVDVLILEFVLDNLGLESQVKQVTAAFESLDYNVRVVNIKMENAWYHLKEDLESFLHVLSDNEETLQIIYYCGHGGMQKASKQNKQPILSDYDSSFNWSDMYQLIMNSASDTLVFLNCCHAGLAAHAIEENQGKASVFRKTLITMGGWGTKCANQYLQPLCNSLAEIAKTGKLMFVVILKDRISKGLLKHENFWKKRRPPQPILHEFIGVDGPSIRLVRLKKYFLRSDQKNLQKKQGIQCGEESL
ncbi:hypothetical protein P171DRAFT_481001 [Karstenula rhodostoma CBS 690.94]|uniref:Peptidase C14 caspase domain-containing protein n=1 Tax=Karstenula rhodostoma CBS 690.94 TaxID=1392251 RepID=A0A9P4UH92_9PLEO|nr:hypothetical protein P171DRAFT_481001 [Karstenula rhodostoma CBS 690.94]